MKNRKKIIPPNKPVFKRSESNINKSLSDNPVKKRKFTSVSLQQNLEFLHRQGIFFPKPLYPSGDADSYFKKTLRNYEQLDIGPLLISKSRHSVKVTKSLDTLKKNKSIKSFSSTSRQKRRPQTPASHLRPFSKNRNSVPKLTSSSGLKELTLKHRKELDDTDPDVFYSPGSQSFGSTSRTLKYKSSDGSLVEEPEETKQMAGIEAEEGELVIEDEEQERDATEDAKETENTANEEQEEQNATETEQMESDFNEESETEPKLQEDLTSPATEEAVTGDETEVTPFESETEGEDEPEEVDELKQVELIIKRVSAELEENKNILAQYDEDKKEEGEGLSQKNPAAGEGSFFKFDPAIDAAVLRELEEAENQAKATAKIIYDLKTRVTELLKKEKHTETEAKELEDKNKELKSQMILFEEKTKRIQFLIAQTNLFDKMIPFQTPLQTSHKEDILPKVIVCGMTENNIPKLILCDDKKRRTGVNVDKDVNIPMSVVPKFAKRLSDSYIMQEKLAAENADLEGTRYKLQSDLLNKDQTIEFLQRQLCSIQCEMRMLYKENTELNEKMAQMSCPPKQETKHRRVSCGKDKGTCPAEIECRLNEYSATTKLLEKQLNEMENDVKTMQTELTAVQAEREHLEQHKKVIICPPVCVPHPPCAPLPPCSTPCSPCPPSPCVPCVAPCLDLPLRQMKEKYARLQDDFKGKVTEVAGLRADNEKLKTDAQRAEEAQKALEKKVKDLEFEIRKLKGNAEDGNNASKQQMIEQEQQLAVAKQRFRDAQDELEELRACIQDQQGQLDDYRNKYLEAQQEVEEQKRQIDMLEMDANRVSEQVNLEIQRIKAQFQEKLQELLPLPELLKTTQIKLQETQQMHLLAERNNEVLNRDLQIYKDKIAEFNEQMEKNRANQEMGEGEKVQLTKKINELEKKVKELQEENDSRRTELEKNNKKLEETERDLEAKKHEIAQLSAQLELVREESARQVARNKERCETVRRSMQNQISDLERQLAQSRAQARSAQKDRDEIRQKMQSQINNLHENFEDAQMRIRSLQGHVNFLKETYPAPGAIDVEARPAKSQDACNCAN